MYASYEDYTADLGPIEEPAPILCIVCGKRDPFPGYDECDVCLPGQLVEHLTTTVAEAA